jgi:hypothetical protein
MSTIVSAGVDEAAGEPDEIAGAAPIRAFAAASPGPTPPSTTTPAAGA